MTNGADNDRKAADILAQRGFTAFDDLPGAIAILSDFEPFVEMEPEETTLHARAALQTMHRRDKPPDDQVAPFRFVTLPDEVVIAAEQMRLDLPHPEGFEATIAYRLVAETPLQIGGQENSEREIVPMRMGEAGNYVIPGATLRGMLRAALEIVAHGRLGAANLHHRFGLRDFDHPHYSEKSPVSKVGLVKAGWLTSRPNTTSENDGRDWMITACDWAHVLIDEMAASPDFIGKVTERANWIDKSLQDKYTTLGMIGAGGCDFSMTFGYSTVRVVEGRNLRSPGGAEPGVPVVAGRLARGEGGSGGNKKFEYAFFDLPGATPVRCLKIFAA